MTIDMSSTQLRRSRETVDSSRIEGFDRVNPRISHTTEEGELRVDLIDGVRYRFARPVSHDHGHLTEVFRTTWNLTANPVVQINATTTFAGRVRAWGLHLRTEDRLFVLSGAIKIVMYDARKDSRTFGRINEFFFSERTQGLVLIPFGLYHGWKNVGDTEAVIISMPSELYEHDGPDRYELEWDSREAAELIPYTW
jgi:dTDP-4-dehydrorhamnose 3,5-epimerase